MKRITVLQKTISLLCIIFIMPATSFASSGMAIYKKYIAQEKKMEKLSKNMIMKIQVYANDMESKSTLYKKGKMMRLETLTSSKDKSKKFSSTMINNGKNITTCSPMTGLQTFPNEEEDEDKSYDDNPLSVKKIGSDKINGITCHKLEVTDHENETSIIWLSQKDLCLVKEKIKGENAETINLEFKKIRGISFPMRSKQMENGKVMETTIIKSIKFNASIPDSKFNTASLKCKHKGIKNMGELFKKAQKIHEMNQNGNEEEAKKLSEELQGLFQ